MTLRNVGRGTAMSLLCCKMARKYVCGRFKLFRKLTSNYLTVYLFNSGYRLVVCMKELGGICVAVVCIFFLFCCYF